jgi:hypothetical protein
VRRRWRCGLGAALLALMCLVYTAYAGEYARGAGQRADLRALPPAMPTTGQPGSPAAPDLPDLPGAPDKSDSTGAVVVAGGYGSATAAAWGRLSARMSDRPHTPHPARSVRRGSPKVTQRGRDIGQACVHIDSAMKAAWAWSWPWAPVLVAPAVAAAVAAAGRSGRLPSGTPTLTMLQVFRC